jgi:hypothetical protein
MRRFAHPFFLVLVVMVSSLALFAQITQAPAKSIPNCNCGPQVRQPYTAEFKITTVLTLPNGTTITRESTEIEARDSQGRYLHSTTEQTPLPGMEPGTSANVNDPVEGTQSNWNSRTKQARVMKLPPKDERKGCWANESGTFRTSWSEGPKPGAPAPNGTVLPGGGTVVPAQRHTPEVEDLGKSTIQGIEVHGHRFTTTIPAGEIGNDQPIVSVSETWSAPHLGLTLREVSDDPRSGKRTRELVNITQGEPDLTMFQPPEGYEVKIEELRQVACTTPN